MTEQAQQGHGFEEVERFLAAHSVQHAITQHGDTYTAAAEARVAAVPPQHAAKTVMVRDADGYVLAVIPASETLDLTKLRRLTSRHGLRLATESELGTDFPHFEVGALPPFGALFDSPGYLDRQLLSAHRILCNGGDHRHSIALDARELQRASHARVADLVAEPSEPR
jgi:Ala-tRNA(Pro) deacylase